MPSAVISQRFPVMARHEGVWQGIHRKLDAAGNPTRSYRSTVIVRYMDAEPDGTVMRQTDIHHFDDRPDEVIETTGCVEGNLIVFRTDRVDGFAGDLNDPGQRACFVYLDIKYIPGGASMYEMVEISPDGRSRHIGTQLLKDGRLLERTLIDEAKVSDDWTAWEAQR
jgi:hypothetical protein